MICPFCGNENVEFIEAWSENFQRFGPAVGCMDCGLHGPVVDKEDTVEEEELLALKFWEEIVFIDKSKEIHG